MYKMIGADGQQYGPVNAEQIRRWYAENRLRGDTLIQAEGSAEWKPLSSFPELAPELKTVPPPLSTTPPLMSALQSATVAKAANKIPAGLCGILLGAFGVHKFILGYSNSGGIMLALTLGSLVGGFLTCGVLWPLSGIMHVIGLIEGIIYLTKSDEEFVRTYVDGRKEWF